MEARLRRLNLSHYAATLRGHEIDDDILKLMTVADLREAGLDATAAQRLHADVSGVSAPPGLAPPPGFAPLEKSVGTPAAAVGSEKSIALRAAALVTRSKGVQSMMLSQIQMCSVGQAPSEGRIATRAVV